MLYGCIFFLLLTIPVCKTFAQQYIFKNYTANEGLVANAIRHIYQDKKGFMWIGTLEGLSKYDGHRFTNYTTSNGLSDYLINGFYETNDGTLYVAANDGSVVIAAENKLVPCIQPSTTIINRFLERPDGRYIVTTDFHGLAEFHNKELLTVDQPFPHSSYREIIALNDSLFLVVNDSSLQVYNFQYELFSSVKEKYASFTDYKVFKDSQKRIWVGATTGLKQIRWPRKKNEPLVFIPLPPAFDIPELNQNTISAIFEDSKQTLWIGTTKGLIRMNPDGSHQLITKEDGLADDNITTIFQDREMNIWFGTTGGLSKLVTLSGIRIYSTESGINSNQVSFVSRLKKDNLLIYSSGSLQAFNKLTDKAITISNPGNLFFYDKVVNSDPSLLLAKGQLSYVDTGSNRVKTFFSLGKQYFTLAYSGGKELFLLYSTEGLYLTNGKSPPVNILQHRTQCAVTDNNGFLWAGTWWHGLYRFKYATRFDSIYIQSTEHYFPGERFRSMFRDSKGNIWAGTRQHGIYIINPDKPENYILLNQRKGLQSDFVKQITEDKEGNIWLAYFQGVDKLIKKDNGYRVFNYSQVNNFYPVTNSMEYDGENSIWLATQSGLVRITDTEMEKTAALPVYITKISSPDSVYSASASSLSLNYRKNKLQFEFSAPGFINENKILYSYRLMGSENNEWSSPSNEHSVSFASLRAGSYTFEVRSQGWSGGWGSTTSFSFEILPPFWQTWWFRAACLVVVIGSGIWLIRRRIKHIRHEAELKHKIAETEMMALRAQMNPHFIFNSLNSIDGLIQSDQKEKATLYLSRFAKLIRAILENSKQAVIPCWKDLETLQLYLDLENLRWDKKFVSTIKADEKIQQGDYKVPPLIVQPYVENAILHGLLNKGGDELRLLIEVKVEKGYIKYIIEDNGVGREEAEKLRQLNKPKHNSMGLQITKERIQLFNKIDNGAVHIIDLFDQKNRSLGTRVEIFISNNG